MTDFQVYSESHVLNGIDDWNQLLDHGLEKPADYIIRVKGSTYEAIDRNGKRAFSGSSLKTVFDSCHAALPSSGGHIHLSAGLFTGADTPIFAITKHKVTVSGEGSATKIKKTNAGNIITVIGTLGNEIAGVILRDFATEQFDSGIAYGTHSYAAIYLDHAQEFIIENLRLEMVANDGIRVRSSYRGRIQNTYFQMKYGDSVNVDYSMNCLMIGNQGMIYGTRGTGWGTNGGWIQEGCKCCYFIACTSDSSHEGGFSFEHTDRCGIIGCTVYYSYHNGIGGYRDARLLILGNIMFDIRVRGIQLLGTAVEPEWFALILGNMINLMGSEGIFLDDYSDENRILHNSVSDCTTVDISIGDSTCDNNWIEGNDLAGANKISDSGTGTIIRRNIGYLTEGGGVATIPNGQTSVSFNHGLNGIAVDGSNLIVSLGPKHAEVADAIWSANDTQITLTVPSAVTADRKISWDARRI